MIKCIQCHYKYDADMLNCPYCGYDTRYNKKIAFRKKLKRTILIIGITVFLLFCNWLYNDMQRTKLDYFPGYYSTNDIIYYTDGNIWYRYYDLVKLWERENPPFINEDYTKYQIDGNYIDVLPPSSVPSLWDDIHMFRWKKN